MTSDRHGITVLNADECWDLLRQTEVGRLAVSIHDEPEVFPINFIVDRGTVVFRTARGRSSSVRSRATPSPSRPTAMNPTLGRPGVSSSKVGPQRSSETTTSSR